MVLNTFLDDRNTATENTGGLGDGFIVVKDEFGGSPRLCNGGRNHHSGGGERGLANEAIRSSSYTNMKSRKQCGCWSRYEFILLFRRSALTHAARFEFLKRTHARCTFQVPFTPMSSDVPFCRCKTSKTESYTFKSSKENSERPKSR